MKYLLSFIIIVTLIFDSTSQIGINTNNPLGIFHIDGLSNNTLVSSTVHSDDLTVSSSKNSSNLSIGSIADNQTSSQLTLGGSSSAFLPNKVALKSTKDITTVLNPVSGMIVYNTTNNPGIGLDLGLYYFSIDKWVKMSSKSVVSTIEYRDLAINLTPTRHTKAHEDPAQSARLSWIDPVNGGSTSNFITLPETGSYAFAFRLYMQQAATSANRTVLYLWAMKGTSTSPGDIYDVAELNIPAFAISSPNNRITYSVTLSVTGVQGAQVCFRLGAPTSWTYASLIANPRQSTPVPQRSSLIFWKL